MHFLHNKYTTYSQAVTLPHMTSATQEAIHKSHVPQFLDLDNQLLVEAFGYSQIPAICIACQNLHKPQSKDFECLASQDGDTVATAYETSTPETPLIRICGSFRSCLPTNAVYDPSGRRRHNPNTLNERVNFHTPPPGTL